MSREAYYAKMKPYAEKASRALNVPVEGILAQWALETGNGTSAAARNLNNHAGIKSNSKGKDYNGGTYAGYYTLNSFVNDYIRVMRLSYYDKVRNTGNDVKKFITELDKSPWAEDKQYGQKLLNIVGLGGFPKVTTDSSGNITLPQNTLNLGEIVGTVNTADMEDLKKWAVIGLGAVMLLGLIKD